MSRVRCHLSGVMFQVFCVTCYMSQVFLFLFSNCICSCTARNSVLQFCPRKCMKETQNICKFFLHTSIFSTEFFYCYRYIYRYRYWYIARKTGQHSVHGPSLYCVNFPIGSIGSCCQITFDSDSQSQGRAYTWEIVRVGAVYFALRIEHCAMFSPQSSPPPQHLANMEMSQTSNIALGGGNIYWNTWCSGLCGDWLGDREKNIS